MREPAAAAIPTDDAPFAAVIGTLVGVSADAGVSGDSDSVGSVRATPVAPAAPGSIALAEDIEFIVRLAFEHYGCDVGESFAQEVSAPSRSSTASLWSARAFRGRARCRSGRTTRGSCTNRMIWHRSRGRRPRVGF